MSNICLIFYKFMRIIRHLPKKIEKMSEGSQIFKILFSFLCYSAEPLKKVDNCIDVCYNKIAR